MSLSFLFCKMGENPSSSFLGCLRGSMEMWQIFMLSGRMGRFRG